jgi:hypothetical protein
MRRFHQTVPMFEAFESGHGGLVSTRIGVPAV